MVVRAPYGQLAAAGAIKQGPGHGDRDAVAERILGGAGLEPGRQTGEHRRVSEGVAGTEQVQQTTLVGYVDGAAVNHPQERHRPAVLREDHRPAQMELDRRLGGDLGELVGGEGVERRSLGQKAGDLAQTRVERHVSSPRRWARCTASVRLRTPSLR